MAFNQRFIDFLDQHTPARPLFPAIHTTTIGGFIGALESGVIDLKECKCFREDLLYCFYGKPAYRINHNSNAVTNMVGHAAACFVFDLETLPEIYRTFAFDTGAAFNKRYDKFIPRGVALDDFRLPSDHLWMAKLVSAFFDRNRNYYSGEAKNRIDHSSLDLASEAYASIVQANVSEHFDERACTFELQFNKPISIASSKLLTVVLPDKVYDSVEVRETLEKWNVKPLLYRMRRSRPEARTEIILEIMGNFYEDSGII
jgi:hypothetical protein